MGHSDMEDAGNGGVHDAGRTLDWPNATLVSGTPSAEESTVGGGLGEAVAETLPRTIRPRLRSSASQSAHLLGSRVPTLIRPEADQALMVRAVNRGELSVDRAMVAPRTG